jgi:hypothetical protein
MITKEVIDSTNLREVLEVLEVVEVAEVVEVVKLNMSLEISLKVKNYLMRKDKMLTVMVLLSLENHAMSAKVKIIWLEIALKLKINLNKKGNPGKI